MVIDVLFVMKELKDVLSVMKMQHNVLSVYLCGTSLLKINASFPYVKPSSATLLIVNDVMKDSSLTQPLNNVLLSVMTKRNLKMKTTEYVELFVKTISTTIQLILKIA